MIMKHMNMKKDTITNTRDTIMKDTIMARKLPQEHMPMRSFSKKNWLRLSVYKQR